MGHKTISRVFDSLQQTPVFLGAASECLYRLVGLLHDLWPVKRQPFAPSGHENDLADLTLALEASPDGTSRRVVLFLLREGSIDADDDVVARRELVVGVFPNLPPVT